MQLHVVASHSTCAHAGPDLQLVLVVFILPPTGANTLLAYMHSGHDSLQLALVVFFFPATGINTRLHLCKLHCVVVNNKIQGGYIYLWWIIYILLMYCNIEWNLTYTYRSLFRPVSLHSYNQSANILYYLP